jgi:putative transposase
LYFLKLYKKHISPIASTYAYCLLGNHFHLLIRIREEKEIYERLEEPKQTHFINLPEKDIPLFLSRRFSHFFNAYTKSINNTYERTGSLFERPFKRIAIEDDNYFTQLIYYIHFNPQKHGIIDDFKNYQYSSYAPLLSDKLTTIEREKVFEWFFGRHGFLNFHSQAEVLEVDWDE